MTDFKITDEAVEAAIEAYSALPARTTFHESMRAALEAALPVMFEQCSWRIWSEYAAADRAVLGPGRWIYLHGSEWHPGNAEPVYRLKEPK